MARDNIILIGMAGVGKSTVGVLLARALRKDFVDTDILIQNGEGGRLQEILDAQGGDAFLDIEQRYVLALRPSNSVVSTGGSVVHSPAAMAHLKSLGMLVLLEAPLETLRARVHNADPRGLVMQGARTFEELYELRRPLYRGYADAVIDCAGRTHDEVVDAILSALRESR